MCNPSEGIAKAGYERGVVKGQILTLSSCMKKRIYNSRRNNRVFRNECRRIPPESRGIRKKEKSF